VRDFSVVARKKEIDREIVNLALSRLNIDNMGLDSSDLKYLGFIIKNYSGGPVGIDTISAGLSEERDSIEDTIEPYLIQCGFINKTARGRVITKTAYDHLGIEYNSSGDGGGNNVSPEFDFGD
jgi:Holliday junction DNA helicase RuvB